MTPPSQSRRHRRRSPGSAVARAARCQHRRRRRHYRLACAASPARCPPRRETPARTSPGVDLWTASTPSVVLDGMSGTQLRRGRHECIAESSFSMLERPIAEDVPAAGVVAVVDDKNCSDDNKKLHLLVDENDPFPTDDVIPRSCKEFDSSYRKGKGLDASERGLGARARAFFCKRTPLQLLLRYLPFIDVLRYYDVKNNLLTDIVAGLSVSVLHTGQGLGYSALAGLPPIYGIYVSFFHVALYFFLGTSKHISVGTYSLTSLLVGAVIDREVSAITGASGSDHPPASSHVGATAAANMSNWTTTTAAASGLSSYYASAGTADTLNWTTVAASGLSSYYASAASATTAAAATARENLSSTTTAAAAAMTPEEVVQLKLGIATSMSFLVGIILSVLGLLRFGGIIANYISPVFISAFTCASAFHIASSQLKYAAFGKHHYIGSYSGPLKLYYLWRDFFVNFLHINWMCSICFLVSMVILFAVKVGINKNKKLRHRLFMPVPVDLIVIVLFTVLSYYFSFENLPEESAGVEVIGKMPIGLPAPSVPTFFHWTNYFGDAFIISILVFIFNYTMANFFKEKYKYPINENQEMLAPGIYHLVTSFFSGFPGSASPPRCFLQDAAGCRTQVSGLVSCVVLILVLYVIAPYLYYLPFAVIAALICVSLKRLMMQVVDLKLYWAQDKIDFAVWIVTFLATFILDIELGMIVGIGFHVFTVALRVQLNKVYAVGRVDHSTYDDVKKYRLTGRPRDVVVVRYNSPILFVNSSRFVNLVTKVVDVERAEREDVEAVVVDCTHVSFIDTAAVKSLGKLRKALKANGGVELYFSGCSPQVRRVLNITDPTLYHSAFLTIRDVELHIDTQRSGGGGVAAHSAADFDKQTTDMDEKLEVYLERLQHVEHGSAVRN